MRTRRPTLRLCRESKAVMRDPRPMADAIPSARRHGSRASRAAIGLALILAPLLTGSEARGQRRGHAPGDFARLLLDPATGTAAIPFDMYANHVYMRGRINDSDSLWVVLDSGASANVIDDGVARALGLEIAGGGMAHGAGGSVEQGMVRDATLRLPGATLSGASFGVIPLDAFRRQTGRGMDVIVGHPLLSRSVVRIDYVARTLEILPADTFRYEGSGTVIPITFEQRLPYIDARITLPGRKPIEGRFVIDLGSSQALILSEPFVRKEQVREAVPKTIQTRGRGVGGQVQSLIGRVTALEFGGVRLDRPTAVMRTSDQGTISAPGTAGNIGGEILKRFTVIFDYSRKRMILEPNARFGTPFEADMAGLGMRMGPEGSGTLEVEWILPESPAAEAGLLPEDLIERVDERPAVEVGVTGLREMFRRDGETHRLVVRRGTERKEIALTTRRLI